MAPNKYLAKVASDLEKPDALVIVDPDRVQDFLDPLPVGRLWGVGRATGGVFEQMRIRTIGELRKLDADILRARFGAQGDHFWQLAHGIDERRVIPDREAKSISHETTFAVDIDDVEVLRAWLLDLAGHVGRRLRRHDLVGRTIQLKLRFADFRTITRAQSVSRPSNITGEIAGIAGELLERAFGSQRDSVRLLGVGVSGLSSSKQVQQTLFDNDDRQKQTRLDSVSDAIHKQFGSASLSRASGLLHNARHSPTPRPGDATTDV